MALEWQAMLAGDKALMKAEIARKTGVSRTRATQIMNLLDLPKGILAHVSSLTTSDDLRQFSERNLRNILTMKNTAAKLTAFQQLRQQCPL